MPTVPKLKPRPRRDAPKPGHAVGLEYDHLAIRAVRVAYDGKGGRVVEGAVDVTGDFAEEAGLLEGLRQAKDRLRMGAKDVLATCLSGKQVSVNEIPFRRLPAEEMESALRLEMRKSVPFEIGGAALDYQVLDEGREQPPVMVALAAQGLLSRQLALLEKAGLAPAVVDVLPAAVANALWGWIGEPKGHAPAVAVHVGPQISTIVIDGPRTPFFNRYIHFAADDLVGRDPRAPEAERSVQALAEEISRSLGFYEKNAHAGGFQEVVFLGEYLETPVLAEKLRRLTGLALRRMDLPRKLGYSYDAPAGRFDLATALAARAGED